MTWFARYAGAFALALAAMAGWSAWMQGVGARKEIVRVEKIGKQLDAKARVVRKKVEAKKPDELQADLRRFCRDCD